MEHLAQMDESEQDEFMREASRNKKSVQTCLPRLKYTEYVCPHTLDARIIHHHLIPAPSKGWCLNPKGLFSGTPYHPLGTPWRVQVYIHIYLEPNCWVLGVCIYIYMYDVHVFFHPTHHIPSPLKKKRSGPANSMAATITPEASLTFKQKQLIFASTKPKGNPNECEVFVSCLL